MTHRQQSYYFDADILLFYFDKRASHRTHDKKLASKNLISQVISSTSINNEITIKIPQVALGEIMLAYCQNKCQPDEIRGLIVNNLNADFPNADFEALSCASALRNRDGNIKPNDALIVAQALIDKSATWLFTTDKELIGNLAIIEKMDEIDHYIGINSSFNSV